MPEAVVDKLSTVLRPAVTTYSASRPVAVADAAPAFAAPSRERTIQRLFKSRITGWTLVVGVLVFWQLSSLQHVNPALSNPQRIITAWWSAVQDGSLLEPLASSLETMITGFALAVPIGVGIGFLMGRSRVVWGLFEPVVEVVRLTPHSAILPIFVLFLGIGFQMQIVMFLVACVFPMIINSYAGAQSVTKVLSQTAQTYRLSWFETQREVALPAAIPYVLVGMRQALGHSLVLAVFVGMIVGESGIGYYILLAQQNFNIDRLMAAVITVALIGYLLNAIFLLLERRISRWRRASLAE